MVLRSAKKAAQSPKIKVKTEEPEVLMSFPCAIYFTSRPPTPETGELKAGLVSPAIMSPSNRSPAPPSLTAPDENRGSAQPPPAYIW